MMVQSAAETLAFYDGVFWKREWSEMRLRPARKGASQAPPGKMMTIKVSPKLGVFISAYPADPSDKAFDRARPVKVLLIIGHPPE
jgi:hypothetical protein